MMRHLILLVALILAASCGRPAEPGKSRQAARPDASRDAAGQPPYAATLQALQNALPLSADGVPLSAMESETNLAPGAAVAMLKATYENDDGVRIEITLSDMGRARDDLPSLPGFDWLTAQIEKETETGVERTFNAAPCKGYEKFDADSHFGQIKALAANRYLAEIFGYEIDRTTLRGVLGQIDWQALPGVQVVAKP